MLSLSLTAESPDKGLLYSPHSIDITQSLCLSLLSLATNFQLSPSSAGARLGPVLSTVTAAGAT